MSNPDLPVPLAPANILVVDDTPANLQLLVSLLKAHGHRARPVTSGLLALQAAHASPPDLVLLDITMPDLDGYEVCRRFKADPVLRDIPVLFISAMNDTLDKVRAFQAGGVDYVTKPFQAEEVEARVRTHLELCRQRHTLQANFVKLQELERLRDSLTHMIVHDMRSPLAVLQMTLDMLADDVVGQDASTVELLRNARGSLTVLSEMAAQMLDISRIEAGQMTLSLQPVNLVDLARGALAAWEPLLGSRQVQVVASAPVPVTCDPAIVRRVIGNLLGNALKFSAEDGVVRLVVDEVDGLPRVAVSDAGPGIAPEFHQKIFEKFGQVAGAKQRLGTGLGLTFCKLSIEAHGGRIGLVSEVGRGSTFWFTLPGGNPRR